MTIIATPVTANPTQYTVNQTYRRLADDNAAVWVDLSTPLTQGRVGANNKPDFDYTNIGYLFPQNDTSEILYFTTQLLHQYMEGSAIDPHVHIHLTGAGTPVMKMDYRWTNIGGLVSANWSTYTMNQLSHSWSSGRLSAILSGAAPIDGTGRTISSELQCKLYRDDNVYSGDLLVTMQDHHVRVNSHGSRQETVK